MSRLFRPFRLLAAVLILLPALVPAPALAERRVPGNAGEIQLSFAPVVAKAAPAVASVYAASEARPGGPFANDPLFAELFRGFGGVPEEQNALGAGVLVGGGLLVTNYHVVQDADTIRVVLSDRREYAARLALADEAADIAVLRLVGEGVEDLPALPIGDSDRLQVGDLVLAIGNPFGVGLSVSSGIVSGLARARREGGGLGNARFFLQTDAPINPGNSGGALVNMKGELVGINTLIVTRSGGSNGLGFAIPVNIVRQIVAQARAGKSRFERPWIGLDVQEVDAGLAEALGMDRPQGLLVRRLDPDSPFERAGLKPGDVLLALDGHPVNTAAGLDFRMASTPAGSEIAARWLRDGREVTAPVAVMPPPGTVPGAAGAPLTIATPGPLQGRTLAALTPDLARRLGLRRAPRGVVVLQGPPPGFGTSVQVGDVILAIDGQKVATPAEVAEIARNHRGWWRIDLLRGNRVITFRTNR